MTFIFFISNIIFDNYGFDRRELSRKMHEKYIQ
jgi:hypothetical protein